LEECEKQSQEIWQLSLLSLTWHACDAFKAFLVAYLDGKYEAKLCNLRVGELPWEEVEELKSNIKLFKPKEEISLKPIFVERQEEYELQKNEGKIV